MPDDARQRAETEIARRSKVMAEARPRIGALKDWLRCYACERPILVGQHYLRIEVGVNTNVGDVISRRPDTKATPAEGLIICNPACLLLAMSRLILENDIVTDPFDPVHG